MAIYKAISAGNADTLAIWETWNGSAWVAASVLPASDDVYTNGLSLQSQHHNLIIV